MIQHQVSKYLKRNGPVVARYISDLKEAWDSLSQEDQLEIKKIVNAALFYDQVKDRIAWFNFLSWATELHQCDC